MICCFGKAHLPQRLWKTAILPISVSPYMKTSPKNIYLGRGNFFLAKCDTFFLGKNVQQDDLKCNETFLSSYIFYLMILIMI